MDGLPGLMSKRIPVYVAEKPDLGWGGGFTFVCQCGAHYTAHSHYPEKIDCGHCGRNHYFIYAANEESKDSFGEEE